MNKQTHYWDVIRKDAEGCFRIGQNVAQNAKAAAELAKHGLQPDYLRGAASAASLTLCGAAPCAATSLK